MAGWSKILGLVADLAMPRGCPGCDQVLAAEDGVWCLSCAQQILAAGRGDCCPRCGGSVGPYLVSPEGCGLCAGRRLRFDGLARVGVYNSLVGQLVKRYKYDRHQRIHQPLVALLVSAIQRQLWADQIEALVPVPAGWRTQLHYRGHPVRLLAQTVGEKLKLPVLPVAGVRGKKHMQKDLPPTQRPANVRGVYYIRRHARLAGTTLCLIDDVSTTGSTLNELARVLKAAGSERVYAAVLAKTNPADAQVLGV